MLAIFLYKDWIKKGEGKIYLIKFFICHSRLCMCIYTCICTFLHTHIRQAGYCHFLSFGEKWNHYFCFSSLFIHSLNCHQHSTYIMFQIHCYVSFFTSINIWENLSRSLFLFFSVFDVQIVKIKINNDFSRKVKLLFRVKFKI